MPAALCTREEFAACSWLPRGHTGPIHCCTMPCTSRIVPPSWRCWIVRSGETVKMANAPPETGKTRSSPPLARGNTPNFRWNFVAFKNLPHSCPVFFFYYTIVEKLTSKLEVPHYAKYLGNYWRHSSSATTVFQLTNLTAYTILWKKQNCLNNIFI